MSDQEQDMDPRRSDPPVDAIFRRFERLVRELNGVVPDGPEWDTALQHLNAAKEAMIGAVS